MLSINDYNEQTRIDNDNRIFAEDVERHLRNNRELEEKVGRDTMQWAMDFLQAAKKF